MSIATVVLIYANAILAKLFDCAVFFNTRSLSKLKITENLLNLSQLLRVNSPYVFGLIAGNRNKHMYVNEVDY